MSVSKQCQEYEAYALRIRKCRDPFPITVQDLLVYIRYRGRNSKFCDYLSNLDMHPLHGEKWLHRMNNDEKVKAEIERFLNTWSVYLPHYPNLIGTAHKRSQTSKFLSITETKKDTNKESVIPNAKRGLVGFMISRPQNDTNVPSSSKSSSQLLTSQSFSDPIKTTVIQPLNKIVSESTSTSYLPLPVPSREHPTQSIQHHTSKKQKTDPNLSQTKQLSSEMTEPYVLIENYDLKNQPQRTIITNSDPNFDKLKKKDIEYYVLDSPESVIEDKFGYNPNGFDKDLYDLEDDVDEVISSVDEVKENKYESEDDENEYDGFGDYDQYDSLDNLVNGCQDVVDGLEYDTNNSEGADIEDVSGVDEMDVGILKIGSKHNIPKSKDASSHTSTLRPAVGYRYNIEDEIESEIDEEDIEEYGYDVEVYKEYIEEMKKKKEVEKLTGIRLEETPLYILSHIAIEKSFR